MKATSIPSNMIIEPSRRLDVSDSADVVVAGAGIAGVAAALAAARAGASVPLPAPCPDAIGITMTSGSNLPVSRFDNIHATGFGQAFQAGGEHVVCCDCLASFNLYGWTFGNYAYPASFRSDDWGGASGGGPFLCSGFRVVCPIPVEP